MVAHIGTDLATAAVQRLIDDAEDAVITRYGAHLAQIDYLTGGDVFIFPVRPVSLVTSIVETAADTDTTLAANDWVLWDNGRSIKRKGDGTNPSGRWNGDITVTYTPVADPDRRKRVIIDLVRLAVIYNALMSKNTGNVSSEAVEYQRERNRILSELSTQRRRYA